MKPLLQVIAKHPPRDWPDVDIDCQCARCGSSVDSGRCDQCEGGFDGHDCGEDCCACLHPEENVPCQYCDGDGVWRTCMSSAEWCEANPLPGREMVQRGEIEWFRPEPGDSEEDRYPREYR